MLQTLRKKESPDENNASFFLKERNKVKSMKKMLLIVGIILIIACVLSLLYAALNLFGYYHVLDGSGELYSRLHQRMIIFGLIGIVLAVLGTLCFIFRSKL